MKTKYDLAIIINSLVLSFIIGILIGSVIFCMTFYIHEFGHYLCGTISTLILQKNGYLELTNFKPCPTLPLLLVPTTTRCYNCATVGIFPFSGILTVVFIFTMIGLVFYYQFPTKYRLTYFFLPILLFIDEIILNCFCGTDNLTNQPLAVCTNPIISNMKVILTGYIFPFVVFALIPYIYPFSKIIWGKFFFYISPNE